MSKPKSRKAKDPKAVPAAQPKAGELADGALEQVTGGSSVSQALDNIAKATAAAARKS